jgi:hypothetical protein
LLHSGPGHIADPFHSAMQHLQPKLLQRAVEIAGSEDKLCQQLRTEPHAFKLWLTGRASAPADVLHAVIDLILQDDVARAAQDRRQHPRAAGSAG